MTAEGHVLFSIASAVFAKNTPLTPVLAEGDWWHIIPSAILTCLLPDIDHPKSFLGQRLSWLAIPISRACGHRGFTHSLLAIFAVLTFFALRLPATWVVPPDAIQGMVIGYLSHIIGDMLTPAGVPLLWPCRWRFRLPLLVLQKNNQPERVLCVAFFICAIWVPQGLPNADIIRTASQLIDTLQTGFDHLIQHQRKYHSGKS